MSLKILFVLQDSTQSRHFISALKEMVDRGHEVTLLVNYVSDRPIKLPGYLRHIPQLKIAPYAFPAGRWGRYARAFRGTRNYLLYRHPRFEKAKVFKERAYEWTDPTLRPLLGLGAAAQPLFAAIEDAIPPNAPVMAQIRDGGYDLVVVSPYIFYQNTFHNDFVKAAHALGVPVGFPVFSWDNLSTKGSLHIVPDRIWVWNDVQKDELRTLHDAPEDRIGVVGAYRFDDYRAFKPSMDRAAFCVAHGLAPAQPIIAYLGSSPAVAPDEGDFVARWLAALRADGALKNANVVVRAHPRNIAAWKRVEAILAQGPIAFQEPQASSLWETQALFDLLSHADVAVGLNTSAMLEAAIHGVPVHSIADPQMSAGQDGTVHFEYLTTAGGGLLYMTDNLPAHLAGLVKSLNDRSRPDVRAAAFMKAFIDDQNDQRRPTNRLVDEFEALAKLKKRPTRRRFRDRALNAVLYRLLGSPLLTLASDPDYDLRNPPATPAA
jgi:hypothetical protein